MQRFSLLTSAMVRRVILTLALAAPVAIAGSAWAQQTPPAATAPAPDAAAPAAAPAAAAPAAAPEAEPKQLAHDMSVTGMVKGATGPVQVVMILLAIASVWSWAIMLDKTFTFAGLNRRADTFLGLFRSSASLDEVYQKVAKEKNNPLVNIFVAGMNELRVSLEPGTVPSDHLREHVEERVTTSMEMIEARESERLGSGMGVLATVGSTSPFIGLFGTVYGIMDSFLGIANTGTTNLAVVAPGIAEALLTTAIGLAAAIPAVIMYNYFARKIGAFNGRMNNFVGEFSTVLSRHLDRKA
jgi:biopolymer transport protein ExbB